MDRIEELTAVLEALLLAEMPAGGRVLYEDHRSTSHVYGDINVTLCRACEGVDGHEDNCEVGLAERALSRLRQ